MQLIQIQMHPNFLVCSYTPSNGTPQSMGMHIPSNIYLSPNANFHGKIHSPSWYQMAMPMFDHHQLTINPVDDPAIIMGTLISRS